MSKTEQEHTSDTYAGETYSLADFFAENLWVVAAMIEKLGGDVMITQRDLVAFGENTLGIHDTSEGLRIFKMPIEHAIALNGECHDV